MAWSKESAASRGYDYAWTKKRKRIMKRDNGLCQNCLKLNILTKATQCDHIIPKAKGGSDDDDNLQMLCEPCHDEKSLRDKGHKVKRAVGLDGWHI